MFVKIINIILYVIKFYNKMETEKEKEEVICLF